MGIEPSAPHPALINAIQTLDGVPNLRGMPIFEFRFAHFRPSPFWPQDINAFPILDYTRDPAPPDGSARSPFIIAVNETQDVDAQLLAATDYVVSILRRQSGVAEVQQGERPIESLVNSADDMDALSRAESMALARGMRAGQTDEVRFALSRWGFGVKATFTTGWLDRAGFVGRIPFFARCYNTLPFVRDAVDRIVSATVGQGGRVVGPSETVRILIEQGSQDARLTAYLAHALRDAILMGAGALELGLDYGLPRPRLIRPERLILGNANAPETLEVDNEGNTRVVNVALLPGQYQPGSVYPSSILEAWSYSLLVILSFQANAESMEAMLPPASERSAAATGLAQTVELTRRIADQFEDNIKGHLSGITRDFDIPRQPLYLRGRELWR